MTGLEQTSDIASLQPHQSDSGGIEINPDSRRRGMPSLALSPRAPAPSSAPRLRMTALNSAGT